MSRRMTRGNSPDSGGNMEGVADSASRVNVGEDMLFRMFRVETGIGRTDGRWVVNWAYKPMDERFAKVR